MESSNAAPVMGAAFFVDDGVVIEVAAGERTVRLGKGREQQL